MKISKKFNTDKMPFNEIPKGAIFSGYIENLLIPFGWKENFVTLHIINIDDKAKTLSVKTYSTKEKIIVTDYRRLDMNIELIDITDKKL